MKKTSTAVQQLILIQVSLFFFVLATSVHAGSVYDRDGDGREGIAESIHALQVAALLITPPNLVYDADGDGEEGLAESIHALQVTAGEQPDPVTVVYVNSIGMKFSYIPAGTFIMGSPPSEPNRDTYAGRETQHSVTLTKPFYQQTTEVTQGQWETIMGFNPSSDTQCGTDCPVEQVGQWDAQYYANALSLADTPAKTPCYDLTECTGTVGTNYSCTSVTINEECTGYRLPTEAQWEYATRAGTTTALYSGTYDGTYLCGNEPNLGPISWYCANSANEIHPVASLTPNDWGLYDTSGNVYEWCEDSFNEFTTAPVSDPLVTDTSSLFIIRGGSYNTISSTHRSAHRHFAGRYTRSESVGFRLVLNIVN